MKNQYLKTITLSAIMGAALMPLQADESVSKPNIIIILGDDVGYGDLSCYGATQVKTPHLDRLAKNGLRCLDSYAPTAVCTPTRFAMLTGEYAWRQPGTNILPGDAPLCIKPGTVTLPSILQEAGYVTGVVGKWHLGIGKGKTRYTGEMKPGPLEIGFDHCFIFPATNDRVPTIYIKDHDIVNEDPNDPIIVSYKKKIGHEPTGRENPELLSLKVRRHPDHHEGTINYGVSRIGWMTGNKKARWKDEDLTETFTKEAIGFIEKNKDKPFFLYVATHTAHEPCVPSPKFKGSSQSGVRGDVIQELDWEVGQIMMTLDRLKLTDNTLLIFSSDNGAGWPRKRYAYLYDYEGRDENSHLCNGPIRGGKADEYEGGTRVPFIASWPNKIKPGISKEIMCLVDMPATCAAIVGKSLPESAGPDSFNILPALLGKGSGREHVVTQHFRGGGNLSIRKGPWKLIPRGKKAPELYNLEKDLAETTNVSAEYPEVTKELIQLLKQIKTNKGSRQLGGE